MLPKINNKGEVLDTFANHFAKHFNNNSERIKLKDVRKTLKVHILKEHNPITISKKFVSDECQLCMEERVWIAGGKLFKPDKCTNKNLEMFGASRHKDKTHRHTRINNDSIKESIDNDS